MRHFRTLVRRGDLEAFRREWLMHPLMQLRTHDQRMHELLAQMVARYQGTDLLSSSDDAATLAAVPDLQGIQQPTLIINGAEDLPGRALVARHLATQLQATETAVIPDAGHLAPLENPQAADDHSLHQRSIIVDRIIQSHANSRLKKVRPG